VRDSGWPHEVDVFRNLFISHSANTLLCHLFGSLSISLAMLEALEEMGHHSIISLAGYFQGLRGNLFE
jgi:hypothetical protein